MACLFWLIYDEWPTLTDVAPSDAVELFWRASACEGPSVVESGFDLDAIVATIISYPKSPSVSACAIICELRVLARKAHQAWEQKPHKREPSHGIRVELDSELK